MRPHRRWSRREQSASRGRAARRGRPRSRQGRHRGTFREVGLRLDGRLSGPRDPCCTHIAKCLIVESAVPGHRHPGRDDPADHRQCGRRQQHLHHAPRMPLRVAEGSILKGSTPGSQGLREVAANDLVTASCCRASERMTRDLPGRFVGARTNSSRSDGEKVRGTRTAVARPSHDDAVAVAVAGVQLAGRARSASRWGLGSGPDRTRRRDRGAAPAAVRPSGPQLGPAGPAARGRQADRRGDPLGHLLLR